MKMKNLIKTFSVSLTLLIAPTAAEAGRGASIGSVKRAVESNSVDAISSELERAEHFTCPACIPMVKPLVDHPDARIRRVAVWWLARRGLRSELAIMAFERLATPDTTGARNAADILGSLRSTTAVEPLSAALANPLYDAETRATMAQALGRIGAIEALPALGRALTQSPESPVRIAAVEAIGLLDGFAQASALLPALLDSDSSVRGAAAHTLGRLRGQALTGESSAAVVAALVDVVAKDGQAEARKRAAWCLGEIAAPASAAAATLERAAAGDSDPLVRSVASTALGKLGIR